jgi:glycosyltransferase involved in cell wall biosynthesis
MIKLLNLIPPGDSYGWGVCGSYLAKHLPEYCEVVDEIGDDASGYREHAILAPVNNDGWSYHPGQRRMCERFRGSGIPIIGLGFHEFDIQGTQQIRDLPKNFAALACGSTWMRDWVKLALHDVADDFPLAVILQGVDHERFFYRPQEKPDFLENRFIIGSAGKFEYRKSQDAVIESFRRFKRSVPEALLLINWTNFWESPTEYMSQSEWAHDVEVVEQDGTFHITGVDRRLIDPADQISWRICANADMPKFYGNCDIGLFPNRCEAAQAMPAVEAIASGVPSIFMNDHGMADLANLLVDKPNETGMPASERNVCAFLNRQDSIKFPKDDPIAHFKEPCISEIVSAMMKMYRNRATEEQKIALSHSLDGLTWSKTAKGLVELAESMMANRPAVAA